MDEATSTLQDRLKFFKELESILKSTDGCTGEGFLFVRCVAQGLEHDIAARIVATFPNVAWKSLSLAAPDSWPALRELAADDDSRETQAVMLRELPLDEDGEVQIRAVAELQRLAPSLQNNLGLLLMVVTPSEIKALASHAQDLWQARRGFVAWPTRARRVGPTCEDEGEGDQKAKPKRIVNEHLLSAAALIKGGRLDAAGAAALHGTQEAERRGEPFEVAEGQHLLGKIAELRRDKFYAIEWYEKALKSYTAAEDTALEQALMAEKLGQHYYAIGRIERALELFRVALAKDEERGDAARTASGYRHLGLIMERYEKFGLAEEFLKRALAIEKDSENLPGRTRCHTLLARIANRQGQFTQALQHLDMAQKLCRESADRRAMSVVLHELGSTYLEQELMPEAIQFYRKATELDYDLGNVSGFARGNAQLGYALAVAGVPDKALQALLRARRYSKDLGNDVAQEVMEKLEGLRDILGESVFERLAEEVGAEPPVG